MVKNITKSIKMLLVIFLLVCGFFFFFIIVFIGEKIIKDLMLRFNFTQFYFYTYFVRWTK